MRKVKVKSRNSGENNVANDAKSTVSRNFSFSCRRPMRAVDGSRIGRIFDGFRSLGPAFSSRGSTEGMVREDLRLHLGHDLAHGGRDCLVVGFDMSISSIRGGG